MKEKIINNDDGGGELIPPKYTFSILDIYNTYVDTGRREFKKLPILNKTEEKIYDGLIKLYGHHSASEVLVRSVMRRYNTLMSGLSFVVPESDFMIDDGEIVLGSVGKILQVKDIFNCQEGNIFWCTLIRCAKEKGIDIFDEPDFIEDTFHWDTMVVNKFRSQIISIFSDWPEYYIYYPILGENKKIKIRRVSFQDTIKFFSNIEVKFRDLETGELVRVDSYNSNWKIALTDDMLQEQLRYLKDDYFSVRAREIEDYRDKRSKYLKKARDLTVKINKAEADFIYEEERLNDILGL